MKVSESSFILEKEPALERLLNGLLEKYEYASILACDSKAMRYSVSKRTGSNIAPDGILNERGFCVKIVNHGEVAEYSFSEIDDSEAGEHSVNAIIGTIDDRFSELAKLIPDGIECFSLESDRLVMKPEDIADFIEKDDYPAGDAALGKAYADGQGRLCFNRSTSYVEDPEELGDEKIISRLKDISDSMVAYDEKIQDGIVGMQFQKYTKLFLAKDRKLCENIMWTCGFACALAIRGEEMQQSYCPFSILGGTEVMKGLEEKGNEACRIVLELLDSEPITPGEYTCICEPDVTGMIVHEAFGHGVEMDMFVKDRALAREYIGKYVASPLITMRDGAKTVPEVASYFFDDEGMPASDTVVIDKGILVSGFCDSQSAAHLGYKATGNGRRESTARKAYTRMTNTIFEAGESKVEDMIASVDYGFLLCNAQSGMEDPKNWGIQCMVSIAREIKDGKLTGKIFSPIVLTGYVPDLLKSISMVSDKVEVCGSGFCGKGYKEWVKVSDGGPYIKARIRLG